MTQLLTNQRLSPTQRPTLGLVLVLVAAFGAMLAAIVPNSWIYGSATSNLLLRRLILILFAWHLPLLVFFGMVVGWRFVKRQITWQAPLFVACLLGFVSTLSLCAIFACSIFAEMGPLLIWAIVSELLALGELAFLRRRHSASRLQAFIDQGRYQAAFEMLQPRLHHKSVSHLDLITAGQLCLRLGRDEEGQRLVEQGLSQSGRDPIALTYVANAYCIQNRYDEALALTDEAIAARGPDPIMMMSRCSILVELDRISEARIVWNQINQQQNPTTLIRHSDRRSQQRLERLRSLFDDTPPSPVG